MDSDAQNLLEGTISAACSVIGFILLILALCRERSFGSKAQQIVLSLAWLGSVGDTAVKVVRVLDGTDADEEKFALCVSFSTTTYLMQAMFNMFTLVFTPTYAAGRTNKAQVLFILVNVIVYGVVIAEIITAHVVGEDQPQVKSLQQVLRAFFFTVGLAMLPASFVLYKSFERWAILGPDAFVTYHLRLFVHLALLNSLLFLVRSLLPILVQINSTTFPRTVIAPLLWGVKILTFAVVAYYLGFRFMSSALTATHHSESSSSTSGQFPSTPPSFVQFPKDVLVWPEHTRSQVDPGTKESNFSLLLNQEELLDELSENALSSSFTPTSTPPRACELDSTRVSRVSSAMTNNGKLRTSLIGSVGRNLNS